MRQRSWISSGPSGWAERPINGLRSLKRSHEQAAPSSSHSRGELAPASIRTTPNCCPRPYRVRARDFVFKGRTHDLESDLRSIQQPVVVDGSRRDSGGGAARGIAFFQVKAHWAAILGLVVALAVAILGFGMPAEMAGHRRVYGALFGLLPIGWIVLNVIFMYQLTNEKGVFDVLQEASRASRRPPPAAAARRVLLRRVLRGRGRLRHAGRRHRRDHDRAGVQAARRGGPLADRQYRAGRLWRAGHAGHRARGSHRARPACAVRSMVGRQLPFFSLLVPFWLIWAFVGFRRMMEIWPAILVAGVSFAVPQFLVSNYHGPWLVDVVAAIVSMGASRCSCSVWHPRQRRWTRCQPRKARRVSEAAHEQQVLTHGFARRSRSSAWMPWVILSVLVFAWGMPQVKALLDGHLDRQVPDRGPAQPGAAGAAGGAEAHAGSRRLRAQLAVGRRHGHPACRRSSPAWCMGYRPLGARQNVRPDAESRPLLAADDRLRCWRSDSRPSTPALDATLGLAFAQTGWLYPFFGAMLGWLGVALTGSDTSSNVLFGGLQKITAEQLGLSPVLMAAANSSGGVMGKMIDAQSIVVASTATKWYGHEGDDPALRVLPQPRAGGAVGVLVMAQAYV